MRTEKKLTGILLSPVCLSEIYPINARCEPLFVLTGVWYLYRYSDIGDSESGDGIYCKINPLEEKRVWYRWLMAQYFRIALQSGNSLEFFSQVRWLDV
jgi:hypothetical protein